MFLSQITFPMKLNGEVHKMFMLILIYLKDQLVYLVKISVKIITFIVLCSSFALATERYFDEHGLYEGKTDENGKTYDSHGILEGSIRKDGTAYDSHGLYLGNVKPNGDVYDKHGLFTGHVDSGGNIFDKHGLVIGKIKRDN